MDAESLKYVTIGLMAFGFFGAAIGVGNIFAALLNAISRNPSTEKKVWVKALIGAAMAELMGLFSVVIAFMLMFK